MSISSTTKLERLHHLESTFSAFWIPNLYIHHKCKQKSQHFHTFGLAKCKNHSDESHNIIHTKHHFFCMSLRELGSFWVSPKALSQQRLWKPFVWSGLWRDRVPCLRWERGESSLKVGSDKITKESALILVFKCRFWWICRFLLFFSWLWVTHMQLHWFWYPHKRFKCYMNSWSTSDWLKILPKGQGLKRGKTTYQTWHIE